MAYDRSKSLHCESIPAYRLLPNATHMWLSPKYVHILRAALDHYLIITIQHFQDVKADGRNRTWGVIVVTDLTNNLRVNGSTPPNGPLFCMTKYRVMGKKTADYDPEVVAAGELMFSSSKSRLLLSLN